MNILSLCKHANETLIAMSVANEKVYSNYFVIPNPGVD